MSFVSKALSGGGRSQPQQQQRVAQTKQVSEINSAQDDQRRLLAKREAETLIAEKAQRKIRSGRRRGLLSYTDDKSDGAIAGLGSAASSYARSL